MKYHIITYGCQMNYSDTERMRTILEDLGYLQTTERTDADVIILNTCTVKQQSEDRIYGLDPQFLQLKKENSRLVVGIGGCAASETGKRFQFENVIFNRMSSADFIFRNRDMLQLPDILQSFHDISNRHKISALNYFGVKPTVTSSHQVYVPVSSGCNYFCSYCIVPFRRGREVYRPMKEIVDEVSDLAKQGAVEVTLVGQTVNSYNPSDVTDRTVEPFAQLLRNIDAVPGIERIRLVAPHPHEMFDDVIQCWGDLKAFSPQIHLPVQSGSNAVLKRMNRRYTIERYKEIVAKARQRIPTISVSTDIIVGFCGETEAEFQETYRLVEELRIDQAFTSKYSPRPGTVAAERMEDNLSQDEKLRRFHLINNLIKANSHFYHQQFLGKTVEVLVEKIDTDGMAWGKIPENKFTLFPADPAEKTLIGRFVRVQIGQAKEWVLEGKKIDDA